MVGELRLIMDFNPELGPPTSIPKRQFFFEDPPDLSALSTGRAHEVKAAQRRPGPQEGQAQKPNPNVRQTKKERPTGGQAGEERQPEEDDEGPTAPRH
jgi:hypothetical protein